MPNDAFILNDSCNKIVGSDWLVSQEEMSNFDRRTISYGIVSSELMERAGQALFNEIIDYIFKKKVSSPLILVGSGNNGGDGLVIARLLKQAGVNVEVLIVLAENYSAEMLNQLDKFIEVGGIANLYSDSQDISCPLLNKSKVLYKAVRYKIRKLKKYGYPWIKATLQPGKKRGIIFG